MASDDLDASSAGEGSGPFAPAGSPHVDVAAILDVLNWPGWAQIAAIGTVAGIFVGWLRGGFRSLSDARRRRRLERLPLGDAAAEIRPVGRDRDLEDLHRTLTPTDGSAPPIVVLHGGRGLGKTALAREYRRAHLGPDCIAHWIPSATETDMLTNLAVSVLGRADETKGSAAFRAGVALDRIRDTPGTKRLLVFDDVHDRTQLADWAPTGPNLRVIVTTNSPDWPGDAFEPRALDLLSEDDAVALLSARSGHAADDPDLRRLAVDDLGRLPLALVQAGDWLKLHPSARPRDYRRRLDRLLDERVLPDGQAADYPHAAAAAIWLSIRETSRDARRLLALACWMDPDALTADAFTGPAAKPLSAWLSSRNRAAPWRVWRFCRDPARVDASLRELRARSLLTSSPDRPDTYSLHSVTARVVRSRLAPDRHAAEAAAAVLAAGYPGGINMPVDYRNWHACIRLTPQVLAMHALPPATRPATLAASFLFVQAASYLRVQGNLSAARALAETALETKQAIYGPEHHETGSCHSQIGQVLRELGDLAAAEPHLQQALAMSQAGDSATEDVRPIRLNNLAGLLKERAVKALAAAGPDAAQAHIAKAQRLYRESLGLVRASARRAEAANDAAALAAARMKEATRLNNLASLAAGTGRPRRARVLAASAVALWEHAGLPPDDPRHAGHCNTLGRLHLTLGDPAAARAPLADALAIREEKLPPGHPHIRATAG
ncbi:MAG: tetratricopeptide repeat protein, partial [Paracoccaceae bacterium]